MKTRRCPITGETTMDERKATRSDYARHVLEVSCTEPLERLPALGSTYRRQPGDHPAQFPFSGGSRLLHYGPLKARLVKVFWSDRETGDRVYRLQRDTLFTVEDTSLGPFEGLIEVARELQAMEFLRVSEREGGHMELHQLGLDEELRLFDGEGHQVQAEVRFAVIAYREVHSLVPWNDSSGDWIERCRSLRGEDIGRNPEEVAAATRGSGSWEEAVAQLDPVSPVRVTRRVYGQWMPEVGLFPGTTRINLHYGDYCADPFNCSSNAAVHLECPYGCDKVRVSSDQTFWEAVMPVLPSHPSMNTPGCGAEH